MLSYILAICTLQLISIHAAPISGKATYYGGNENGNACGFKEVAKSSFPYGYYAATGSLNFDTGYGCGKCFRITCIGPDGNNPQCFCSSDTPSVIVQTLDQCPECSTYHFDLNPTAMERIVAPGLSGTCGVIEITYERVPCDYNTPIRVRNKAGTSRYWYGLHLDNIAGAGDASSIELRKDNNKVGYCTKDQGPSFWICTASSGTFPNPPIDLKLVADDGSSITAAGCITSFAGGASMICNTNFDSNGNGGGNTGTPAPTTTTTLAPTPATGGGVGGNIVIENKNGLNQWWYAVVVTASDGVTITSVKMRDSDTIGWELGVSEWDYIKFTKNAPYNPPMSFQIKLSNKRVITKTDVLKTLNPGEQGVVTVSSAYLSDDNESDTISWAAWFGICMIILIIIAIGVGTFCYIQKRKSKIEVGFDNKYVDDDVDDNNKEDDDVNTNDKDDEQE
eukprot:988297_1